MLTTQEIEIIKNSVPFLKVHGEKLTTQFYQTMFANNPEVKKFFNQENQKSGKQPAALAQSIIAAANNIDNLAILSPIIEKISIVHCDRGIEPKHYPIVGQNLLLTLKSLLGESATPEFITAWRKAYDEISQVFITTEQAIYARRAHYSHPLGK